MGEVRIKSGNLYPIPIGEDLWGDNTSASHQNNDGELVVVMGTGTYSGVYSQAGSTINAVHSQLSTGSWSVEIKADSPMNLRLGFEADGVKTLNITTEYQKFTFSNQSFTSDRAFVVYNSSGVVHTVYLRNFMLNEGSTALPYQPYFLNRPAHQFTNGEWIDIPTHHFINGRWQGELTSQSPLEFHATGQSLLDWRIDGASGGVGDWDETEQKYKIPVNVKGGTLFDISDTYSAVPSKYNITNDTISMVLTTDWGGNYIKFNKTYEAGTYTFRANITRDSNMTISLWSNKSFVGSSYNSYYKGYVRAFNGSLQTYTFSEDFRIGFTGSGATGLSGSISDFQILKGTYTSETMPPYESYITNLYTDHQLMDGDSIDFSTTETTIPLATGNNTLMINTAVQPKSVFVKFEG